jgi:tellurite resistance protein
MSDAGRAMVAWVGALARGGLLMAHEEEVGAELALRVLGEAGLSRLRTSFASQSSHAVARQRRGAIHACIWMAQADREIVPSEIALLESIIAHSDLSANDRDELEAAMIEPQIPERFAEELTAPELRELIVALAWQLAHADGRVDDEERAAIHALCDVFEIADARADEIRRATLAPEG